VWTNALPRSYIPGQLLARLPLAFLLLMSVALVVAATRLFTHLRELTWKRDWRRALQHGALMLARRRAMVVVVLAVLLPLGFMIVERATMYDGVRHILFVVPMLAIIAAAGLHALLPVLLRAPLVSAGVAGAYV